MSDTCTEHFVDGIKINVFNLPDGHYCALIVSTDVVFQATFNAELKTESVLTDYVTSQHRYHLEPAPPTPEMLTLMKLATLEHMAQLPVAH